MPYASSTVSVPHPGRLDDAIALAARAAKVIQGQAGTSCRLLATINAGEASGALAFVTEYEDAETYGRAGDALVTDAEFQSIMTELRSPQSPVAIVSQSSLTDVPLDRTGNSAKGNYLELHVSTLTPGRVDDELALAVRVADFVESHGATNAGLATFLEAGDASGDLLMSWEYDSFRTHAAVLDAWGTDPVGMALFGELIGADPPSTRRFSALYAVVPL